MKKITLGLAVATLLLLRQHAFSQASLVKDIDTRQAEAVATNNYSDFFCNCGNFAFFTPPSLNGNELWRTDGTTAGTYMLKDINPGINSSLWYVKACNNGKLFFIASDNNNFLSLWSSDGTSAGTQPIKQLPTTSSPDPGTLVALNGAVYFLAYDFDGVGIEFWKSDGTNEGTTLVGTIPSLVNAYVEQTVVAGDKIFFKTINLNPYGHELWTTDGTIENFKKIYTGGFINPLTPINNKVFFNASTSDFLSSNVYVSDGTATGTEVLVEGLWQSNGYFSMGENTIFSSSGNVWMSDGTVAGTNVISSGNLDAGVTIGNTFYGIGFDYNLSGNRILKVNGQSVESIALPASAEEISIFRQIYVLDDNLVIPYYSPETGQEPGLYNINSGSYSLIKDIFPGTEGSLPKCWTIVDGKILFLATDGIRGTEIWATDGTESNTSLIAEVVPGTKNGVTKQKLLFSNGVLHFMATTDFNYDIWATGGEDGAYLKNDVSNGFLNPVGVVNEEVIYLSYNTFIKTNSSSTTFDTVKVWGASGWSFSQAATFNLNNKLVFSWWVSMDGINYGKEFWITDGTDAGTHVIKDVNPNGGDGVSGNGLVVSSNLYFDGNDPDHGIELWKTDGTEEGTVLVKDINPGTASSRPSSFAALNESVIFSASTPDHGTEVWISDGTETGTQLLKDLVAGSDSSHATHFASLGDVVVFAAFEEANGWQLWKTDGTSEGTTLVRDLSSSTSKADAPKAFFSVGSKAYFAFDDGIHGNELWSTDGTDTGTVVFDLAEGAESSNPSVFTDVFGVLYFNANQQLWRTNGTEIGTSMIADFEPIEIIGDNNVVYFIGAHPEYGIELFKSDFTKLDQTVTLTQIEDKLFGEEPFAVEASSSSGMPITVTTTDELTVVGKILTIVKPGTVEVIARQDGDALFNAAEASTTFCVLPAKPVVTMSNTGEVILTSNANEGNQWFVDEALLEGETSTTLTVNDNGAYQVQVTLDGCASEMSDVMVVNILGSEDAISGISVYPNPATDQITIAASNQNQAQIKILDVFGKPIGDFDLSGGKSIQYSLKGKAKGLYMVQIRTKSSIGYIKVVKE